MIQNIMLHDTAPASGRPLTPWPPGAELPLRLLLWQRRLANPLAHLGEGGGEVSSTGERWCTMVAILVRLGEVVRQCA